MQITLIDGRTADTDNITFNAGNLASGGTPVFSFTDTGEDLDNLIYQRDMSQFSGWDATAWNYWRAAHPVIAGTTPQPITPLNSSVTGNLVNQLITDPLAAPADALAHASSAVTAALAKPTTWLIGGGILLAALLLFTKSE